MAKVSTSAVEARGSAFAVAADGITMNRERLLNDASGRRREMAGRLRRAGAAHRHSGAGREMLATLKLGST
jgi:hypothetical protein